MRIDAGSDLELTYAGNRSLQFKAGSDLELPYGGNLRVMEQQTTVIAVRQFKI
jgi:hypothetical protein